MSETRTRLVIWGHGPIRGEYLAADVLDAEGFSDIDPVHPQGGRDGGKDVLCRREGVRYVVGCFFTNDSNRTTIGEVRAKFTHDVKGVVKNGAQGFIFVTNNHIPEAEQTVLRSIAEGADCHLTVFYALEKLRQVLDSVRGFPVRLRYLDIPMTREEQVALFEAGPMLPGRCMDEFNARQARMERMVEELLEQARARPEAFTLAKPDGPKDEGTE